MKNTPMICAPYCELAIVILNYRTPDLVTQCLESLVMEREGVRFVVIVVDNNSGDGSVDRIEEDIRSNQWEKWVSVIRSDSNRGFAGGNNLGLALVKDSPYVLLLNSDTIVHSGCLARCLSVLKSRSDIGALSCRLLNSDGSIQNAARKFPDPIRTTLCATGLPYRLPKWFGWAITQDPDWDRATECRPVDWLGGAFLMVPQAVLQEIGYLDEDFFFYGEDVEFCHRVHRAGYLCWYEATVSTIHLGAGSSDVTRLPPAQRNRHRVVGRYLEQRKLYGRWAELLVRSVDATVDRLRSAKSILINRG